MDCNRIAGHCRQIYGDLLPCGEQVDIDGIQSALSGGTTAEEQRIDVSNVSIWVKAYRTENGHAHNIEVCRRDSQLMRQDSRLRVFTHNGL